MPQTPSSSNEITQDSFNKTEWYKALGIIGSEPVTVGPEEITASIKRAGELVRAKYGPKVFGGVFGAKLTDDLRRMKTGEQFRIIEPDFLLVVTRTETGASIELGFSGEQAKVALVEGKTRLNEGLDLKFLMTGA